MAKTPHKSSEQRNIPARTAGSLTRSFRFVLLASVCGPYGYRHSNFTMSTSTYRLVITISAMINTVQNQSTPAERGLLEIFERESKIPRIRPLLLCKASQGNSQHPLCSYQFAMKEHALGTLTTMLSWGGSKLLMTSWPYTFGRASALCESLWRTPAWLRRLFIIISTSDRISLMELTTWTLNMYRPLPIF